MSPSGLRRRRFSVQLHRHRWEPGGNAGADGESIDVIIPWGGEGGLLTPWCRPGQRGAVEAERRRRVVELRGVPRAEGRRPAAARHPVPAGRRPDLRGRRHRLGAPGGAQLHRQLPVRTRVLQYYYNTTTVLLLQYYDPSTTTVLLQYYYSTTTVLPVLQYYYNTTTVLLQYYYNTTTVLLQYYQYYSTTTILLQYYYNTTTVLPVLPVLQYYYNTTTVLLQYYYRVSAGP